MLLGNQLQQFLLLGCKAVMEMYYTSSTSDSAAGLTRAGKSELGGS